MRLVIVSDSFGGGDVEQQAARELGVEVVYRPVSSLDELPAAVEDAEGILVQFLPVDARAFDACPKLRVVGRYGVGFDNVDVADATARGIAVVNVPDYCTEEVATHALALVLAGARRLPRAQRLVRDGRWEDWHELEPIRPLTECTLGLVGLGRISVELLRQGGRLFHEVLATDPYARHVPEGVRLVGLDELLARSDVVSLHLPYGPETDRLMNAERLALMRPGSLLVNVSRGGLVDTAALAGALDSGRPGGAALDVLPHEPPASGDPLLMRDDVIVTNHVAWYSARSLPRLRRLLARRCAAVLTGGDGETVVNWEELRAR